MKRLLAFVAAGALMFAASPFAADTKTTDAAKTPNVQQQKMKTCSDQAGDKKGDERKAFMKTCLSAAPVKAESKMAMCNKKTAGMNKEDRAKAQSECMKGA